MLPSEMLILMAIATNDHNGKTLLERPMDVTSEYIGYLYNSLVSRGFLERYRSKKYRLTRKGKKVISNFLSKNAGRADEITRRLHFLGIDINPENIQLNDTLQGEPAGTI